jgi:hypothetical protein
LRIAHIPETGLRRTAKRSSPVQKSRFSIPEEITAIREGFVGTELAPGNAIISHWTLKTQSTDCTSIGSRHQLKRCSQPE